MAATSTDFEKLKGDKQIPTSELMKRIYHYVKPEFKHFIFAILLMILSVVLSLILPLAVQGIVDQFDTQINQKPVLSIIFGLTFGYLALNVIGQVFAYFQAMILQKAGQRIIYNMRMEVFEHIENMSLNQFNEMPVGSLVTRVANYTTSMSDLFTNVLVNLLRNIFTVIAAFFILLFKSPLLTLILCSFIVIVFIVSFIFRRIITKIFRKERALLSDMNTFLNENLSGMKITQIFNQEKRKEREFLKKNNDYRKTRYKVVLAFAIYRPFITFLYYLAIATTFFFGIKLALSPGEVVAFYMLLGSFFNPIQNIADQLNHIQRATTASERLFNLLDVQPEVVDDIDAVEIEKFEGHIEFKNVWFAYEKDNWILKDVSFEIKPKQTAAFVGATGAGKTTILSLIVRNYEIQKGQILIDGIDIRKIKITSLRKGIGQMLQDVFLFTGSVRSNITLHDESFSDEQIIETCKYVNADSFIEPTSEGLDAEVAERGENYSQGQRQLMSFARTVLHQPQILILDEATANIDTETEVLIQESLEKIKNIGTMLVVAHRLSTIQKADLIVVLQKGEVIEKGNHQSLLKQKGHYYKLYKLQFENK